jgi:hypothetical protein
MFFSKPIYNKFPVKLDAYLEIFQILCTPSGSLLEVVLDKFWVKHYEYKS